MNRFILLPSSFSLFESPSSRGPGHRPFTAATRVRIPLGTPNAKRRHDHQRPVALVIRLLHCSELHRPLPLAWLAIEVRVHPGLILFAPGLFGLGDQVFGNTAMRQQEFRTAIGRWCKLGAKTIDCSGLGRRIVQAWRHRRFPEGVFSMTAVDGRADKGERIHLTICVAVRTG